MSHGREPTVFRKNPAMCSRGDGPGLPDYADWLMNASWRFAFCANAIKGDLVRRGAFASAHICEKNCFPQSTVVSPTRLADRASMRGSVTLDVVHMFKTQRSYGAEAPMPAKMRL